ncbi:MAG: hypothetical protein RRZ92_04600 [Bacilli bacterium]
MDNKNFVKEFKPTKQIGSQLRFDMNLKIVRIKKEYFRYDEIEDFECIENMEKCKVDVPIKTFLAFLTIQSLIGTAPYGSLVRKDAEELVELKFQFKIKGESEVIMLDLMENEREHVVVGTLEYQYYEKLKKDILKSFSILMKKS